MVGFLHAFIENLNINNIKITVLELCVKNVAAQFKRQASCETTLGKGTIT